MWIKCNFCALSKVAHGFFSYGDTMDMQRGARSYAFEDYLNDANNAQTVEDLFSVFIRTVKKHGLDRAIFSLATDHRDIGETSGLGIIHNYPEDWLKYYDERDYDKIDPVLTYGVTRVSAFTWKEIPQNISLSKEQINCLNMGQEAGLYNGIATPLRGPSNQLAGIALASSERYDSFDGQIDLITSYCNHFYIAYKRLKKSAYEEDQQVVLSAKETEVLTWIGAGKSYLDVATITNISRHAVDYHMRNIFKKLQVNDARLAVVKALTLGLIRPI